MWGCTLKMARTGSVNTDTVGYWNGCDTCHTSQDMLNAGNSRWDLLQYMYRYPIYHEYESMIQGYLHWCTNWRFNLFCNAQQNNTLILKIIKVFCRKTLKSWKTEKKKCCIRYLQNLSLRLFHKKTAMSWIGGQYKFSQSFSFQGEIFCQHFLDFNARF